MKRATNNPHQKNNNPLKALVLMVLALVVYLSEGAIGWLEGPDHDR